MSYITTDPAYFENFTSVEVYMNDTQVATQTYGDTTLYTVQKGNRIKFLAKGVDASKKSLFQGINFYGGNSGTTPANITVISSDWVTDSPNDYQIIFDIDADYNADFRAVTSFAEAPSNPISVYALQNYSQEVYMFKNSAPAQVSYNRIDGIEANDVITLYTKIAPNYNISDFYFECWGIKEAYDSEGTYLDKIQLFATEATPGTVEQGYFVKAYTIDATMVGVVADGYSVYFIPKLQTASGTFYDIMRPTHYGTPQAVKDLTTFEYGIADYDAQTQTLNKYKFDTWSESSYYIVADETLYLESLTQPITEGEHAGAPVLFDTYGSSPEGITQPNLVFNEARFASTGESWNKLPSGSFIVVSPTQSYFTYTPLVKLKYGEAPTPTTTYDVTFKAGETTVDTVSVEENTAIPAASIPEAPSVTGMEFDYWALNGEEFDFDTLITENIELDAVYKVATLTVTYKEGNETIATEKVAYGKTAPNISPLHPTDESGDEFIYWIDENNAEFDFSTPITDDITLTAYYVIGGNDKWVMALDNCYVGLADDIEYLPKARVLTGTKALAISDTEGSEKAYMFYRPTLTWIELQKYSVNI